ncbi:MAG TPA: type IVB secretion system protein IcmH/DotU, partial [Steroidobacteraceae bacterium]|nr:type IVB secretion system protein IcmH/DotU [Steroidobacteraceae bacterium]
DMSNNNSDDPFAPSDATILRPRPGAGRRPTPAPGAGAAPPAQPPPPPPAPNYQATPPLPRQAAAPAPAPGGAPGFNEFLQTGINPLVQAAIPLLMLAGRLRGQVSQADVEALRRQTIQEVRSFEERARVAGVPAEDVMAARYALCTAIDEAVLNTPWGSQSGWSSQSLLVTFHREAFGGEKFFQILERVNTEPGRYLHLLELLYLCLALGFEGKYRLDDRGQAQLADVRIDLYRRIESLRGGVSTELSPHWKGVQDKRNGVVRLVPLWVVAAACVTLLVITLIFLNARLGSRAEPVNRALAAVGNADVVAVAASPSSGAPPLGISAALAQQIADKLVSVQENDAGAVVIVTVPNLFGSGTAKLNPSYVSLVETVSRALAKLPGQVTVVGHTDNQSIRSFQFKDNFELSRARAENVVALMRKDFANAARLDSRGLGPSQPRYTPEDDPENQARNRRVEIVYRRGN